MNECKGDQYQFSSEKDNFLRRWNDEVVRRWNKMVISFMNGNKKIFFLEPNKLFYNSSYKGGLGG